MLWLESESESESNLISVLGPTDEVPVAPFGLLIPLDVGVKDGVAIGEEVTVPGEEVTT